MDCSVHKLRVFLASFGGSVPLGSQKKVYRITNRGQEFDSMLVHVRHMIHTSPFILEYQALLRLFGD